MKVLFVIQHPDMPSSRVRVLDLLPDLRAAGIDAEARPYPRTWRGRPELWRACRAADVVVLQKKLPTALDAALLRRACRRLVYDFDDAVYFRHESRGPAEHPTSRRRFASIVRRADLVLAGNRVLAAEARRLGARAEILPSAVEIRGVPVRDHAAAAGPLVIGWIGTEINLGQAALLGPILRTLAAEFPLEYRIVCRRGLELEGVRTAFVPWAAATQAAEVARFDIGVMPLPKSAHAEGKCGYKALQYMAAGVPPVVSDVGINRELVGDGACGLVAEALDDFAPALRRLAAEPALRARLGWAARAAAEREYAVPVVAARLGGLLRGLAAAEGGRA
jgi:glycosyltransferase involved in cell wall biosynthesis